MNIYQRPCQECGHPFAATSARSRKRFCSDACRARSHRRRSRGGPAVGSPWTASARALSLAWDLGCADRADAAHAALEALPEAEARAVLGEALGLVGNAIDRGQFHDELEAAGLLELEPEVSR